MMVKPLLILIGFFVSSFSLSDSASATEHPIEANRKVHEVVYFESVVPEYIALVQEINQLLVGSEVLILDMSDAARRQDLAVCTIANCNNPSQGTCACRRIVTIEICNNLVGRCIQTTPCSSINCGTKCDVSATAVVFDVAGKSTCMSNTVTTEVDCEDLGGFYDAYKCGNPSTFNCTCSGNYLGTLACPFEEDSRAYCPSP
jgi:hypothetical protein